jgi:hypothetical protein
MSSQLAVRLGAVEPVISHLPPGVVSLAAAEEAIELADAYGVADGYPLAESQRITLRAGLGERADGSWAATRIADFGPRQGTGKNDKIAARELAGLILFGEKLIIHTAHEFPTANESFLRLVAVFENWDDLRQKVARIRYANGEQGIELLGKVGGGRLKYRARTGGSLRGFAKADLVVYDEAQHLGREHVAASGPAKMANPNAQTWYAGSGGLTSSAVAWAIRRAALLGTGGRLAYTEMTAEIITVKDGRISASLPDALDRDVWYATIPGLGRWVTEEAVEALYDELGPDLFLREILCVWDPEPNAVSTGDAFSGDQWLRSADPDARRGAAPVFGVDIGEDRLVHIAVAWRRPDQRVQVMLAESGMSPLRAPERLAKLAEGWNGAVVLGGTSSALEVDGAHLCSGGEFADACGAFEDLLNEDQLRHGNQDELNRAVTNARWRKPSSTGARSVLLAGEPTVGPLAAVIRAVHGVNTGLSTRMPMVALT